MLWVCRHGQMLIENPPQVAEKEACRGFCAGLCRVSEDGRTWPLDLLGTWPGPPFTSRSSGLAAILGAAVAASPAFVYLLRCRDGSLYCGWTTDLEARVARHREGKASRYTRSRLPVELAWSIAVASPTAARREEARIKQLSRTQKLLLTRSG